MKLSSYTCPSLLYLLPTAGAVAARGRSRSDDRGAKRLGGLPARRNELCRQHDLRHGRWRRQRTQHWQLSVPCESYGLPPELRAAPPRNAPLETFIASVRL